jgi:phosphoribosyl-AMP cyclohydrolase
MAGIFPEPWRFPLPGCCDLPQDRDEFISTFRAKDKEAMIESVDFHTQLWLSRNITVPHRGLRRLEGKFYAMSAANADRESGSAFMPRFDAQGLLTAIAVDSDSREILMVAFMDAEALEKTRETGLAHFHSRSRGRLWLKGETSGHFLRVQEIRVDCDQDALVMLCKPEGPACHTGARSCFYRKLEGDALQRID